LKTILGMHFALAGMCVSAIKPTVFDALMFAISCGIMVSSLVISVAFFEKGTLGLQY
jgi:hypothetical protein